MCLTKAVMRKKKSFPLLESHVGCEKCPELFQPQVFKNTQQIPTRCYKYVLDKNKPAALGKN